MKHVLEQLSWPEFDDRKQLNLETWFNQRKDDDARQLDLEAHLSDHFADCREEMLKNKLRQI